MFKKVVALEIKLVQDDIDYLRHRAAKCLQEMGITKSLHEKKKLWQLFNAYNDLYEQNKDKV